MHDSSAAAETPLAAKANAGDASPEQEAAKSPVQRQRQHRSRQAIETDAERIRSSVVRLISNSVGELEELTAELQKLQEFLKAETDRVHREIDSVLSGVNIIIETIAPWKDPAMTGLHRASAIQGPGARERLKHWPAPPAE